MTAKVPMDFSTIQQAVDNLAPSGIVTVENGTYYEYVRISKSLTLSAKSKIVIDGKYRNYPDSPFQIGVSNANNVVISGFTFLTTYTPPCAIGIHMENCSNVVITNCTFERTCEYGIHLVNVSNAIITNNFIDAFFISLLMHGCNNVTISYNTLEDADCQFQMYYSRNIVFHHNNIFNDKWSSHPTNDYPTVSNTTCAWDDGKFGNYWSDYKLRYPNATEVEGLGIWDTPYQIDPDDIDGQEHFDYYPLVTDPQPPVSHGRGGSISLKWL